MAYNKLLHCFQLEMGESTGTVLRDSGTYSTGRNNCFTKSSWKTLKTTFVIIGITCLVYAIAELINWFKFLRLKPQNKMIAPVEDAEIIEDEA